MSPLPSLFVNPRKQKQLAEVTKRMRLHRALTPRAPMRQQRTMPRIAASPTVTPQTPRRLPFTSPFQLLRRTQRQSPRQRTRSRTLGMRPGNNGGVAQALNFRAQAITPFTPRVQNRRAPSYRRY